MSSTLISGYFLCSVSKYSLNGVVGKYVISMIGFDPKVYNIIIVGVNKKQTNVQRAKFVILRSKTIWFVSNKSVGNFAFYLKSPPRLFFFFTRIFILSWFSRRYTSTETRRWSDAQYIIYYNFSSRVSFWRSTKEVALRDNLWRIATRWRRRARSTWTLPRALMRKMKIRNNNIVVVMKLCLI